MKRWIRGSLVVAADGIISLMLNVPVLERVVLGVLRHVRNAPVFSHVWKFVKNRLCQKTVHGDRGLRWVRLAGGAVLYVPIASWGSQYFERETYEPATTDFILKHLSSGHVFVDVGANYGYFTILAASLVGSNGRVYSFEPNPAVREVMARSVKRNKQDSIIRSVHIALFDHDDEKMDFYVATTPYQSGLSSLVPWSDHLLSGSLSLDKKISVQTLCFDSWIASTDVDRIDTIKVDVEGAEMNVLRGMQKSLIKFAPRFIICETALRSETTKFLEGFGYRVVLVEYLVPAAEWGNILYQRFSANTKG